MNIITSTTPRQLAAAAAVCCVALLPGMALAASARTPSPAQRIAHAATSTCETPGLVIWLDTNGNGAAGSVFYHLQFTNLSGHPCTMNGFPFIRALDVSGHLTGRRAAFTSATPHAVTVRRGATVKAVLQLVNVGNFPASRCKPTTAAGFEVFPPNQTRPKIVPFPFGACSNKHGPAFMRVAPITK